MAACTENVYGGQYSVADETTRKGPLPCIRVLLLVEQKASASRIVLAILRIDWCSCGV